jgi:hypothetical protein
MIRAFIVCALLLFGIPARGQPTHQPPTATELFNLRERCARLGEKIMSENVVGVALTQSQKSRYDPRTSRCFVELTVQAIAMDSRYLSVSLFDGQTKEMLASLRIDKEGKKWGMVFDRAHPPGPLTNAGFDHASDYINKMMSQ